MGQIDRRTERMVIAARLYYEQNLTQNEIGQQMGISRPMVSLLLSQAREKGIVTITIHDADSREGLAAKRMKEYFRLKNVVVVPDRSSAEETDNAVAAVAFDTCLMAGERQAGIGWGSMLGRLVSYAEKMPDSGIIRAGTLFPLIGGIGASNRSYHTNELVRVLAMKTGYQVEYLYFPAFFDSESDLDYARRMDVYRDVDRRWRSLDLALVNISNFPSYPDLAVEYHFSGTEIKGRAAGRLLAYYYNERGELIRPVVRNAMQPTVEQLRAIPEVAALCSGMLRPESVVGALRLGLIQTIFMPLSLAEAVLERVEAEKL